MSDWDSLRNLQLLIQLEKEFKIKFNQKELVNFNSLESILKILIKKINDKNKNIKDLIETFRNEKKIALVYNGKKISYENLYNDIISFSYEISTKSKKGFNIAVVLKDDYEVIISLFAIIYSGSVPLLISEKDFLKC